MSLIWLNICFIFCFAYALNKIQKTVEGCGNVVDEGKALTNFFLTLITECESINILRFEGTGHVQ